ncbi:MAG: hypothetical protein JXO72_12900, partial [Vicinamibacteria bacterium]|nr:hypothetical protein [Vicinamibacteria bacterium]
SGELRGVCSTSSLELGIDVGALDEVLLVQTPPTLASAAQRIGRAGHAVGAASRARFFPLVPRDLLDAAVVAPAVLEGAIETAAPVSGALDVLAQAIVSIVATETWRLDDLFALVRRVDPYHELPRRSFDLVVEMLAGTRGNRRIRALNPLVFMDRAAGTLRGLPGAARRVYLAGGTIPDRGYYRLRIEGTGALLGELDEEFVWERSIGDSFTLGVQTWRIERVTHNDVFVSPGGRRAAMAPFWRADERHRRFETMERVALFLESTEPRIRDPRLREELIENNRLAPDAADALIRFLGKQMRSTGGMLPHRHRVIIEHVRHENHEQVILHTLWGGRVNLPFALALSEAWERRHGAPVAFLHEDDCIVVSEATGVDVRELLAFVTPDNVEDLLRALAALGRLRRALPRCGRDLASSSARGLSPPHAAVARAPEGQGAAAGGVGLRRFSADDRGLARVPRRRLRSWRPAFDTLRTRFRPHRRARGRERAPVSFLGSRPVETHERSHVRGRHAVARRRAASASQSHTRGGLLRSPAPAASARSVPRSVAQAAARASRLRAALDRGSALLHRRARRHSSRRVARASRGDRARSGRIGHAA